MSDKKDIKIIDAVVNVWTEEAIQDSDEQEIIDFLNDVESKGGEIFSVDSTIDAGLRVSGFGGIISLLRFPLEY